MKKLQCKNEQKFGYWTVIDNTPVSKKGHIYIKVRCKCGKEQEICLSDLVHKRTTGCKSCKAQERKINIQIGDTYKHWEVIEGPEISKSQNQKIYSLRAPHLVSIIEHEQKLLESENKKITKVNGRVGDLTKTQHSRIKRTAEVRAIEFDVDIKYLWNLFIAQNKTCALTGDYLEDIKNASLDRIDSSVGYVEGNVQWTTKQANLSKHLMTKEEFLDFCKKVVNKANQQPSQEKSQ